MARPHENGPDIVSKIPHHIAIIMDGNRRWARRRGATTLYGHREGAETLKRIARHSGELGTRWLSVFAFSFENWGRAKPEIDGLMGLLHNFLENDIGKLSEENVKLRVVGERKRFTPRLAGLLDWAEKETEGNSGLNLTLALDYGGKQEIALAARRLATEVARGMISAEDINEDMLKSRMNTAPLPQIDLLIRTGGDMRLSNFMLWDMSYAELHFSRVLWPDFSIEDLDAAIKEFGGRERRFGGDGAVPRAAQIRSIAANSNN